MYPRKQAAQRRWLLVISLCAVISIGLLSWWQSRAAQRGTRSPAEQLLLTILSPSLRMGGAVRNALAPNPQYALDPTQQLPAVGMARLQQLETENQQLRALLALRSAVPTGAIPAEVIGRSSNPWQGYLLLGKGSADGVAPHMIALTPAGVLGQVATVTAHEAEVMLLTDPASGIGALLARARETGVLKGFQHGQCRMIYLSEHADVRAGDLVVTSGLGAYYPKGFPLGAVLSVSDDPALSSRVAIVAPAANPATVEMVLLTK
ncbi:MAG TPA: rod shape-determining protein MreC [Armatimonadota bacterium]|jgi:rod shape-determining protein MreC